MVIYRKKNRNRAKILKSCIIGIEDAPEEEILQAVARGRHMIKEMIGVIQLKKYREMNKRYCDLQEKEQK